MKRDNDYLQDMLEYADRARVFVGEMEYQDFLKDNKTQAAVIHSLMIIGEAANCLSEEFCEKHTELPWRSIVGMRNRLIHGYGEAEPEIIWNAVKINVPRLITYIQGIK